MRVNFEVTQNPTHGQLYLETADQCFRIPTDAVQEFLDSVDPVQASEEAIADLADGYTIDMSIEESLVAQYDG
ncbi:MAG: hypothetical protein AAGF93_00430 [Cyanobacteria bacterium P01_H01_bin.105]